jgi:flagellar protein FlbD
VIELTRFDGSHFFINVEFIEFVEATPDTVISLIDHKKLLVREPAEEVVRKIADYHRQIGGRPVAGTLTLLRRHQEEEAQRAADEDEE